MLIIGITGIIGAGKSTVAKIFKRDYEALVIDADKIGHELLKNNSPVNQKIIQALGTNQRKELAKLVFGNPAKLKILNKITHPAIRKKVKDIIQANFRENLIIIDAALLFTIGLHCYCSKIIFIEAAEGIILQRLVQKGLSANEIKLRLRANQSVLHLKTKCDYIIENNGSKKELIKNISRRFSSGRL